MCGTKAANFLALNLTLSSALVKEWADSPCLLDRNKSFEWKPDYSKQDTTPYNDCYLSKNTRCLSGMIVPYTDSFA